MGSSGGKSSDRSHSSRRESRHSPRKKLLDRFKNKRSK